MSGSDDKFEIIEEARVKYVRLGKLFERMKEKPNLPEELAQAISDYERQGAISNSMKFIGVLSREYPQLNVPESLKGELQRIATWSEWQEFDASPEVKAQLSADRIHLCSPRYCGIVSS